MELAIILMLLCAVFALLAIIVHCYINTIDRIESERDGQPYRTWRELL